MKRKWVVIAPLAALGLALFVVLGGGIVQLLWNWLLPPILGLREISFLQALGLLALCRILFGGFGGRFTHSRHMSPEERERFRQRIRERCGWGQPPAASPGQ